MYHNRPTVADMRAMKACGQKISMLYVTNFEEAMAAAAAGINMLYIEGRCMSPEMREAAGDCFIPIKGAEFEAFLAEVVTKHDTTT